ncbi:MAG: zinc ABC transporter solute-binding protein [Gammaproteobacteria bacterium]|nr:zinc ABC transporter solute-binding protein [Gammaproteobacteria bacterium]
MNRYHLPILSIITSLFLSASFNTSANIRVFACEPEWGALVEELAGDKVTIFVATTAQQDPHHIEARPSLIAKMRRADIAVCTGAELEVGWLPLLLRISGNKKIQANQPGYFEATSQIETLDKPEKLDRSLGDVHASGNPHVHLGPYKLLTIAESLKDRFVKIDSSQTHYYEQRFNDFKQRWLAAILLWEQRAKPIKNSQAIVYHKNWAYLFDWLHIRRVAELEPIPGVPPSAAHLAKLKQQFAPSPPNFILYGPHQNAKPANWLAKKIDAPAIELPFTIGGNKNAVDLFSLYSNTIDKLLIAMQ